MTRAQLSAFLAALVAQGRLTEADATALARYADGTLDAGDLPEVEPIALAALGLYVGSRRLAAAVVARYRSALPRGVAAAVSRGDGAAVQAVLRAADRLPLARKVSIVDGTRADDLRAAFSREVERRTAALRADPEVARLGGAPGSARRTAGDVPRWRRAVTQAYAEDAAALARLGTGGDLTAAQQLRLAEVVAEKARYVEAFRLGGLSEAQVRAALVRQSGEARALFFENAAGAGADGMDSPVYDYIARPESDGRTCSPCLAAEAGGPYLVGQGPLPSSVCLGGGACRCRISIRNDPEAFARLTSTRRAA